MGLIVGLTGGIGCGKSTVADMFGRLGAKIIDTDLISHALTAVGGAALPQLVQQFGEDILMADGALDRAKLRRIVFADVHQRKVLESILHPMILDEVRVQLASVDQSPYIVIVVPLLFASPVYLQLVQRVLVVDCSEELQVSRVVKRSGLSESEARNIIAQQTSRAERLRRADDVISNGGDLSSLAKQVECLHANYFSSDCRI